MRQNVDTAQDERRLARQFSELLGTPVLLRVSTQEADPASLAAGEVAQLARFTTAGRRSSWLRGRRALKRVLAELGESPDTSGIVFPHPFLSLTHSGEIALAIAVPATRVLCTSVPTKYGFVPSIPCDHAPGSGRRVALSIQDLSRSTLRPPQDISRSMLSPLQDVSRSTPSPPQDLSRSSLPPPHDLLRSTLPSLQDFSRSGLPDLLPNVDTSVVRAMSCSASLSGVVDPAPDNLRRRLYGIGVDYEMDRTIDPHAWRFFLTEGEVEALRCRNPAPRNEDLLRLWTVKEALFKADPLNHRRFYGSYEVQAAGRAAGMARALSSPRSMFRYASSSWSGGVISVAILLEGFSESPEHLQQSDVSCFCKDIHEVRYAH